MYIPARTEYIGKTTIKYLFFMKTTPLHKVLADKNMPRQNFCYVYDIAHTPFLLRQTELPEKTIFLHTIWQI